MILITPKIISSTFKTNVKNNHVIITALVLILLLATNVCVQRDITAIIVR
jgi:hypothetical protein